MYACVCVWVCVVTFFNFFFPRSPRQFQHENLVRLYGVCTKQGPIFIVQELMVNGKEIEHVPRAQLIPFPPALSPSLQLHSGCLLQYLRQHKDLVEKTEIILDMAVQICSAMKYLESSGFIHRDLVSGVHVLM